MKSPSPKVIVKPHYIGTEPCNKIFKRIIVAEIQRKIKLRQKTT